MMDDVVATLSDEECWQLLAGEELGRLVTRVGDVLDIFPVNYVVDEDTIVFRTAEGSKLVELTVNDEVLFAAPSSGADLLKECLTEAVTAALGFGVRLSVGPL